VQRTHTYGLQRVNENQLVSGVRASSFYGNGGGGHVRVLSGINGTVTDTDGYDAFGNAINSTSSTSNNYLYRGERYDPGLDYVRASYYNPLTGRFMSRDGRAPKRR
jgi:RHS repeat-associated protein